MTKTYSQVLKQIDELKQQAERLRRGEVDGVVKRIREAIQHYGLSASDLGLGGGGRSAKVTMTATPGRKPGRPKKVVKIKVAPKFRDENGNTWAGRGKRPIWLRDALLGGRRLEDFAVK